MIHDFLLFGSWDPVVVFGGTQRPPMFSWASRNSHRGHSHRQRRHRPSASTASQPVHTTHPENTAAGLGAGRDVMPGFVPGCRVMHSYRHARELSFTAAVVLREDKTARVGK